MAQRLLRISNTARLLFVRNMSDSLGSGAGKGGGAGGSIRSAGGAFGEMEAAREEQYFKKLQQEQLAALKESLHDEIHYHEKEIKEHEADLQRHKEKLEKLQGLKDQ